MEQNQKKEGEGFDNILDAILTTIEENEKEMAPKQTTGRPQSSIRDKARREATKKLIPRARITGITQ